MKLLISIISLVRRQPLSQILVLPVISNDVAALIEQILHEVNHICSNRILTFGIRNICSPAKVGIGYYKAVKLPAR